MAPPLIIHHTEYDSLSRCLDGEMTDTRDSKSRAKKCGGSSPLQGNINRFTTRFESSSRYDDRDLSILNQRFQIRVRGIKRILLGILS
ncbi:hypothetical protein FXO38_15479 [Capsicum annuum]|uniref:Uncharacterized protein n=1 Tax=Capsicum annuum TaxID=4072 RepID=A0A2G2YN99_CAPAN|nr:hypothetical protein FXO37_26164 [Capsicum annuum]KAF3653805.1 hypothetical protein FXO38_15479 [Capsicum annuum]PHT71212.1 hypothetical protein T459_26316 [Capsicum annuum]